MKSLKKTVSIILSLIILTSVFAVASAPVHATGNSFRFDASGWKGYTLVYCHIWERGRDAFWNWQSKKEACKKVSDNIYEYNLDAASITLDPSKDYCVIFSTNLGQQSYDLTLGKDCIGDTAKLTDNQIENPVDPEKKAQEAVWTTNSLEYGPHLAITSIGNVVGSNLCPYENGTEVIGDWLATYYKSQFLDPLNALVKAYPVFGIQSSDYQIIYNYIKGKTDLPQTKKKDILDILTNSFNKAFPPEEKKIDDETVKESAEAKVIKSNGGRVTSESGSSSTRAGMTSASNQVKAKTLKKSNVAIKPVTVTYKLVKKGTSKKIYKKIKVNRKTGKITLKKGKYKKGTYKVRLRITVKCGGTSDTLTRTVKFKIK